MRRTNKEFYAEVCRRKSEILRAQKARNKRIFAAVLCLPLCCIVAFTCLSLAISMQGAGSASPGGNFGNTNGEFYAGNGISFEETVITAGDSRQELLCLILGKVTSREPESGDFTWNVNRDFSYKITLADEEKTYYLNRNYLFDGTNTFSVTAEEYAEICDILK